MNNIFKLFVFLGVFATSVVFGADNDNAFSQINHTILSDSDDDAPTEMNRIYNQAWNDAVENPQELVNIVKGLALTSQSAATRLWKEFSTQALSAERQARADQANLSRVLFPEVAPQQNNEQENQQQES